MHPELRVENLFGLPEPYRATAISAAQGSIPDMRKARRLCGELGAEGYCLVPVFYYGLDTSGIPSAADLDVAPWSSDNSCILAMLSLNGLAAILGHESMEGRMSSFSQLVPDLWPRAWNWIVFFDKYWDSVPCLIAKDPRVIYSSYCFVIRRVEECVEGLVDQSPGLRRILTYTWKLLITGTPAHTQEHYLYSLASIPDTMHEVLEGTGGTYNDLASIIVLQMKNSILTPSSHASGEILLQMAASAIMFITSICFIDVTFKLVILSHGIIKAEVAALCSLTNVTHDSGDKIQKLCLPCYPNLRRAIKAGLLRLIITLGQKPGASCTPLQKLLVEILPQSTVYHSVLSQLERSLCEVEDILLSPDFVSSDVYEHWSNFVNLAQSRIAFMKQYDRRSASQNVCYSSDCWIAKPKTEFRCCSGCREALYCSVVCQSADWTTGGHRHSCNSFRTAYDCANKSMSKRDLSFLRALVHAEYVNQRPVILCRQTTAIPKHPPASWMAIFHYDSPGAAHRCTVSTTPIFASPYRNMLPLSILEELATRFVSSVTQGDMEIHGALIAQGSSSVMVIFPLRIRRPDVRIALSRIGRNIPEGVEETQIPVDFPDIFRRIQTQIELAYEEVH
ncbi:hypothetical protein B0H16DRAFT_1503869 [Mycena metata]|uniref:MYND-type domain-containing protein n=1 Tax=Mycena metata TaxID=1033252 RepID=A0AAD7NWV8_9AGAR|nr:hypothetical protein B0H16DRAFT_1503869 [Mycena metata]